MIGLIAILVVGTVTGRMHWLGAAFAALIPMMKMGFSTLTRFAPMWMNHTGGVANFSTEHLDAQVHIQTGTVTGSITKGQYEGRSIESLSPDELKTLENNYKDTDKKSYYIIRYSQRKPNNHEGAQPQAPAFANPGRDEALQILGLSGEPTHDEITQAHRKLINRVHPDKGGNDFLASRINQARDVLTDK